jgi:hypothetical protein
MPVADVRVLCFSLNPIDQDAEACLRAGINLKWHLIRRSLFATVRAVSQGLPPFAWTSYDSRVRKIVSDEIKNFKPNVVHTDLVPFAFLFAGQPTPFRLIKSINDAPTLYAADEAYDRTTAVLRRLYLRIIMPLIKRSEKILLQRGITRVVSEIDAGHLRAVVRNANIAIIPNQIRDFPKPSSAERGVGFFGVMTGSIECLLIEFIQRNTALLSSDTRLRLHLGGSEVGMKLKVLAAQHRWISVTTPVRNLDTFFGSFSILVNPLRRSCGVSNKLLYGMAAGKLCIGYAETFAGIPFARHQFNCFMLSKPEDFGPALKYFIANPEPSTLLANRARGDAINWAKNLNVNELSRSIYLGE